MEILPSSVWFLHRGEGAGLWFVLVSVVLYACCFPSPSSFLCYPRRQEEGCGPDTEHTWRRRRTPHLGKGQVAVRRGEWKREAWKRAWGQSWNGLSFMVLWTQTLAGNSERRAAYFLTLSIPTAVSITGRCRHQICVMVKKKYSIKIAVFWWLRNREIMVVRCLTHFYVSKGGDPLMVLPISPSVILWCLE